MNQAILPFTLPGCVVDEVRATETTLTVVGHAESPTAECPKCHQPSTRLHSHYTRSPCDLPVSDQAVRLVLQVRRFFCDNPTCEHRTFAERFPALVPVRAQRTARLTHTLQRLALTLGGEVGARIVTLLHMAVSADTLLRLIRLASPPSRPAPRVLGVDDFALRRGRTYGTLLVDLERHQVVDVLKERTAEALSTWLQTHDGVEIISRDRSTEYARGATAGAPQALQVADRWHILQNLRQVLERLIARVLPRIRVLPVPSTTQSNETTLLPPMRRQRLRKPYKSEQVAAQASRSQRLTRYQAVQALHAQGVPMLQIAKRLHLSRGTVRKFVKAAGFPEQSAHRVSHSILDAYESYLHQRFTEGCRNAQQLWRELQAQGFAGTHRQVTRWLALRREQPSPYSPKATRLALPTQTTRTRALAAPEVTSPSLPALPSARQLAWLLVRNPAELDDEETRMLLRLRQASDIELAYTLAQQFSLMVKQRKPTLLDDWLMQCVQSGLAELQTFAAGLRQEYAAIRAALTEAWSNGQLEGQVNRLKLIKRQMYGRATFDLLRQRVLLAT